MNVDCNLTKANYIEANPVQMLRTGFIHRLIKKQIIRAEKYICLEHFKEWFNLQE